MQTDTAGTDQAAENARPRPLSALVIALLVGLAVTMVGELLVGDASGGGVDGAREVGTDAAVAGIVSLLAVLLARWVPRAMVIVLTVLTLLAAGTAWYTAMAFVFGSAAFALSRPYRGALRTAGTIAGTVGALVLLLFVGIVVKELLLS